MSQQSTLPAAAAAQHLPVPYLYPDMESTLTPIPGHTNQLYFNIPNQNSTGEQWLLIHMWVRACFCTRRGPHTPTPILIPGQQSCGGLPHGRMWLPMHWFACTQTSARSQYRNLKIRPKPEGKKNKFWHIILHNFLVNPVKSRIFQHLNSKYRKYSW